MTPRREIYNVVKDALNQVSELELVGLYRGQFEREDQNSLPKAFTAALIRIGRIEWDPMTEDRKEGTTLVDIMLYTKDGWANQYGEDDGLSEIDLIDTVTSSCENLRGDSFEPLRLAEEETEDQNHEGIMSYRIAFSTKVYKVVNRQYSLKKINIT